MLNTTYLTDKTIIYLELICPSTWKKCTTHNIRLSEPKFYNPRCFMYKSLGKVVIFLRSICKDIILYEITGENHKIINLRFTNRSAERFINYNIIICIIIYLLNKWASRFAEKRSAYSYDGEVTQ